MRDIVGYEGRYKVTEDGRVWSEGNKIFLKYEQHYLGYLKVDLCKEGLCKKKFVHRLVAEAYLPNPEKSPFVNHIDGNKANPHLDNLEWVTESQNYQHARAGYRRAEEENEAF